nr:MAG TPA: hypothetical protein [Caudoviricetes sp.]
MYTSISMNASILADGSMFVSIGGVILTDNDN